MSCRSLRLGCRRLLLQFLEPSRHEVIHSTANDPNTDSFIKCEFQLLELVLERSVVPWYEISSSQPNHFRQVVPQQDWEVCFQGSAGGNNGLAQQIAQGTAFDC